MIGIVNYGVGNIQSVYNAFAYLKCKVFIINTVDDFKKATAIVIPGVGHFKVGMNNMIDRGFIEPLNSYVVEKKIPCLGICVGLQIMAEIGLEGDKNKGMGWIPGVVERIDSGIKDFDLRIPHVGWNETNITKISSPLFKGMKKPTFYFVHSFFFNLMGEDSNSKYRTSYVNYGRELTASVEKDNIYAVQFHPEKSQEDGLKLLKNFLGIVKNG